MNPTKPEYYCKVTCIISIIFHFTIVFIFKKFFFAQSNSNLRLHYLNVGLVIVVFIFI